MTHYVLLCRHAPHDAHTLTRTDPEKNTGPFPTEVVADVLREHLLWQPPQGPDSGRILLRAALFADTPEARQTLALLGRGLAGEPRWKKAASANASSRIGLAAHLQVRRQDASPPEVPSRGKRLQLCGQVNGLPEKEPFEAKSCAALAPERGLHGGPHQQLVDAVADALQDGNRLPHRPPAVLVVGHQPQLGQLADELGRHEQWAGFRRWRRLRVPLRHGEIACLVFEEPRRGRSWRVEDRQISWWRQRLRYRAPRVVWTISPDDKDALNDIRDKVKSKLETAKLLGGVITVVLGALLALLFDEKKREALKGARRVGVWGSAGLLLAAVALYLATVYAYDRLLMPPRFWAELSPRTPLRPSRRGAWLVRRPPSSSAWLLFQNMQRVWWGLFTTATACFGLALLLLALTIVGTNGWVFLALVPGAIVVGWLIAWFRPILGSED
jgi:hypothetical protein